MTRCLLFVDNFELGGTQRQLVRLAKHLVEDEELELYVGCFRRSGPLLRELSIPEDRVSEYPLQRFYDWNGLRQAYSLARYVRRRGIDVVHGWDFYAGLFCTLAVSLLPNTRLLVSRRYQKLSDLLRHRFAERMMYRLSDGIVCNASSIADDLERDFGSAAPITVIPNSIEVESWREYANAYEAERIRQEDRCRVGMVARLDPRKGCDVFVEAAAVLAREWPNLEWVIVGDGELQGELEQRIARLGLEDSVLLAGRQIDVRPWIGTFDVAVLASSFESFPNVLLEYMAAGRPVVATRVGGIPDIVRHGVEGRLIEPEDPDQLAEAVGELLRDPERRARMSRAAVARASQFDIDRMSRAFRSLYLEGTAHDRPSPVRRETARSRSEAIP